MTGTIPMLMKPVGPVAEAFVNDKRLISGIMGPVGSAKTTTCIRKCIYAALWQGPGPDGVYRARGAVVRDTYPQLRKTVLESWFNWFPKAIYREYSGEPPMTHKVRFQVPGRGIVEIEMIFAAIGENKVEDVMRGWELTFLWINEADLVARDVLRVGLGRIGRFPDTKRGGCTWRGIFVDFNAPDVENWTYDLFVEQKLGLTAELEIELKAELGEMFGVGFHRQPGGRSKNPPPENIANLPKGYYAQQMIGQSVDFIRRFIDNQFGPVRSGHPVYPEYSDGVHCSDVELVPDPSLELILAADAGLTPALLAGQEMPDGQIRVYAELATIVDAEDDLNGIGPTRFGEATARLLATSRFSMFRPEQIRAVADPSSEAGTDGSGNELSWMRIVSRHAGVRFRKARTNDLNLRLEAVRRPLGRLIDGRPGLLIDGRNCPVLRRGFNSGYVYRRVTIQGGDGRYENKPAKNQFSHVHDANQYLCLEAGQGVAVLRGENARRARGRGITVETDYDIFGDTA